MPIGMTYLLEFWLGSLREPNLIVCKEAGFRYAKERFLDPPQAYHAHLT